MGSDRPVSSSPRLFEVGAVTSTSNRSRPKPATVPGRTVRVIPDVSSITREFVYLIPDRLLHQRAHLLEVGTLVRVPLHGRNVAAWISAVDVEAPEGVELQSVTKMSSIGPAPDVVDLCRWASWRWCGRTATFLGTASPPTMNLELPRHRPAPSLSAAPAVGRAFDALFDTPGVSAVELPPADDPTGILVAAARRGPMLVICPTFSQSRDIAERLRRAEVPVALHPDGWWRGVAGSSVIGTRSAAFAPVEGLSSIIVIDEHEEVLQNEGSPTWNAREVAIERGRRAGIPVVLVSPVPSIECRALAADSLLTPSPVRRRRGWAKIEVIDRREDDLARTGLFSPSLVRALQSELKVLCVLNRTGRAQMLACLSCGTLATCERCEASVRQDDVHALSCPICGLVRPVVCGHCGSGAMKQIRIGVTKAADQLETLLREPVEEIVGAPRKSSTGAAPRVRHRRVVVGTVAAMHRVGPVDVVAFLEFDQELAAPRYRASDQALALLARASRLVGGRNGWSDNAGGRVLVQTRQPENEVLVAAQRGQPDVVTTAENSRRALLMLPPAVTLALIGGDAAPEFIDALRSVVTSDDVIIDQQDESQWIVRSRHRDDLLNALGSVKRPPGRLRLQIDPARLPTPSGANRAPSE